MNTNELIANLSTHPQTKLLRTPLSYAMRLGLVLLVYTIGVQAFLGLQSDLERHFTQPMFVLEIVLLLLLALASVAATIFSLYPDAYQKQGFFKYPYIMLVTLIAFIVFQLTTMPYNPLMILPVKMSIHDIECTLCIASVSIVPSTVIFGLLRKGASLHPLHSGAFSVLTASSIGCFCLRLAEANESLMHLASWHYLPMVFFAILGAWIGKVLLKW